MNTTSKSGASRHASAMALASQLKNSTMSTSAGICSLMNSTFSADIVTPSYRDRPLRAKIQHPG